MNRINLRIIAAIIFICLTALLVCACGNREPKDITLAELDAAVSPTVANSSKLTVMDDDYIAGMISPDLTVSGDRILKLQTEGTELDQYGLFKLPNEKAVESAVTLLESYIKVLSDSWGAFNYLPGEQVKLDSAKVSREGNYVWFTILSADETAAFDDAVKSAIY